MKRHRRRQSGKEEDDSSNADGHDRNEKDHGDDSKSRTKKEIARRTPVTDILNNNLPITEAINKGLVRLEIMVQDTQNGKRISLPLSSLLKRKDF